MSTRARIVSIAVAAVAVVVAVLLAVVLTTPVSAVEPDVRELGAAAPLGPAPASALDDLDEDVSVAVSTLAGEELLIEQRPDFARPLASITKIITALVVLDAAPLAPGEDGPVYVPTADDEQTYADLFRGGSAVLPVSPEAPLTQRELLEATLVASSANHAIMFGFQTFGDIDEFRTAAKLWLVEHGFRATEVVDPAGLSSLNRSTPREMLAIARLALENPVIAATVAMPTVEVPGAGTFSNRNAILGVEGIDGMKTGTTDVAGYSFLFTALVDAGTGPERIIGIIMGAASNTERFTVAPALLREVRSGFQRVQLPVGTVVGTYAPEWGGTVDASLELPLDVLAWRGELHVELDASAPASAGTTVGRVTWIGPDGPDHADAVLDGELPGPDLGWLLVGRWG